MTLKELCNAIEYHAGEKYICRNKNSTINVLVEFFDMENHKLVLYVIDDLVRIKQSNGGEYFTFRLKL